MSDVPADFKIPYQVPVEDLPAPLPDDEAIDNSCEGMAQSFSVEVLGVGDKYVVKYGSGVRFEEGWNMIFVGRETNIPVPKVYAMYERGDNRFIVMERIHGSDLGARWKSFKEDEKASVLERVGGYLEDLRSVRPPQHAASHFGGIWRQPFFDVYVNPTALANHPDGPMESEREWVERLVAAASAVRGSGEEVPAQFVAPLLASAEQGRPPVLTHGDLHTLNFIQQDDGTLVVIDWEYAGWCPAYYERCRVRLGVQNGDWAEDVGELLGEDTQETEAMESIVRWMYKGKLPGQTDW